MTDRVDYFFWAIILGLLFVIIQANVMRGIW